MFKLGLAAIVLAATLGVGAHAADFYVSGRFGSRPYYHTRYYSPRYYSYSTPYYYYDYPTTVYYYDYPYYYDSGYYYTYPRYYSYPYRHYRYHHRW